MVGAAAAWTETGWNGTQIITSAGRLQSGEERTGAPKWAGAGDYARYGRPGESLRTASISIVRRDISLIDNPSLPRHETKLSLW